MSLILRSLVVMLLATFLPVIHAASISLLIGDLIQPLPVADYPIPEMVTSSPSPECEGVNGGSRLCCESTFNGDVPLIKELAPIIGFKLNRNSVNGIYCEKDEECAVGTDLCCQVDSFPKVIPTLLNLAMYCQNYPRNPQSEEPTSYSPLPPIDPKSCGVLGTI